MNTEMTKWVVQCDAGMPGTDAVGSHFGKETKDEVEKIFQCHVIDWADSYDHSDLQDDDGEIDEDALEERYSELSAWAEEYDPDKHDGLLASGEKWIWDN